MIRAIGKVIRGEGVPSAIRRASERIGEALQGAALRARGALAGASEARILNVAASGTSTRLGGVQVQLGSRLQAERDLRNVALLTPGILDLSAPSRHTRRISSDLETGIREAIELTGARTIHLEGMHGVPFPAVLRLIESGIDVIVSVHDFALFCARPHLIEEPMGRFCFYSQDFDRCHRCLRQTWDVGVNDQRERRILARQLLTAAKAVISPSRFLLDEHRQLFSLPELAGEVIEPGVPAVRREIRDRVTRHAIAFAGGVKRHKGAHLLPDLARGLGDIDIHVFGGGDEDLLREMRRIPNITIHGYYRSGELPSLLARDGIGLVVIPSIWPETYCLVMSEAWLAGAAVAAFDFGAQAERIRQHGGGWLAPLESGAEGLARIIEEWRSGRITAITPRSIPSPEDAARAHIDLYRKLGVL